MPMTKKEEDIMKIAINGFGRIGRLVFRLMEEDNYFDVVAINDLSTPEELAYLLKYDTNHRNYDKEITYDEENIIIEGKKVRVYKEIDPTNLPWKELGIDLVFECTGKFTKEEDAMKHITAGAKKVLVSAPCKGNVKTVVYNVNDDILKGFMTTIHAYTNDQVTLDVSHKKGSHSRRGRACAMNIVPTSTGAATAIGKVIPNLEGKLSGGAIRVPVSDGSLIDLSLELEEKTTEDEINSMFLNNESETIKGTFDPIVSSDIISSTYGAVVDLSLTKVLEVDGKQLVKIIAWYDNEMGYSAQMVRTAKKLLGE